MRNELRIQIRKVTPRFLRNAYRHYSPANAEGPGGLREIDRLQAMVGPPGVWQESREFQVEFLRRRGLLHRHRILDIGCGPLRGGIPLIRYLDEGRYTGLDIRPDVIDEARRQIEKEGLTSKSASVVTSTSFGCDELGDSQFDFIWCFQVFYHLYDDLAGRCLEQVSRRLAADGSCFANVNLDRREGRWKEFPYLCRSLKFYEALANKNGLKVRDLGLQRDWGYTDKVPGQFEHMLEFRRSTV
jgi:SAM-dependent methyltransferase